VLKPVPPRPLRILRDLCAESFPALGRKKKAR
jgi:hypothetical protein